MSTEFQAEVPFANVNCFICEKPLYFGILSTIAGAAPPYDGNVFQPVFTVLVICAECQEAKIAPLMKDQRKREGCRISFLAGLATSGEKPS